MKFSYKDNWIWYRFTCKTCPRQVTSHCIQICYLQSMQCLRFLNAIIFFACFRSRGRLAASFVGRFWETHCLSLRVSPRVGRNRNPQDTPHTFCIAMLVDRATLSSNKGVDKNFEVLCIRYHLTMLTHVKVSVRCLFKEWSIQSFSVVITFSAFFVFIYKSN